MEKGRAEYSGSSYIAANSIRLLPGFTGPSGDTFLGRIGYSEEDALALNNTLEGEFLQVIDYRYNVRRWLKQINDPSAPVTDDLFDMELRYNTPTGNGARRNSMATSVKQSGRAQALTSNLMGTITIP